MTALSVRQIKILNLLCDDHSRKEICLHLGISRRVLNADLQRAKYKAGVCELAALVRVFLSSCYDESIGINCTQEAYHHAESKSVSCPFTQP